MGTRLGLHQPQGNNSLGNLVGRGNWGFKGVDHAELLIFFRARFNLRRNSFLPIFAIESSDLSIIFNELIFHEKEFILGTFVIRTKPQLQIRRNNLMATFQSQI
jgi:hypothetical protein